MPSSNRDAIWLALWIAGILVLFSAFMVKFWILIDLA